MLNLEHLESRVTPTAYLLNPYTVQYLDVDGETATVTVNQPIFTDAATANSILQFDDGNGVALTDLTNPSAVFESALPLTGTPGRLSLIDLGNNTGISVSVLVTAQSGNGLAEVVQITSAASIDKVVIDGRLDQISAGSVTSIIASSLGTDPAGALPTATSEISGDLNYLKVLTNVDNAFLNVSGKINQVIIQGNLGNDPTATGNTGDLVSDYTAAIVASSINTVQIKGQIWGNDAAYSGYIGTDSAVATAGNINSIFVGGSFHGGNGYHSASIHAIGTIAKVNVNGSLLNDLTNSSGQPGADWAASIMADLNINSVVINGSIQGGIGHESGSIWAQGNILSAVVKGSLIGGGEGGHGSGSIHAEGNITSVTVSGSVTGGLGNADEQPNGTGNVDDDMTDLAKAGFGNDTISGGISAGGTLGKVTIGKDLQGGTGIASGGVFAGTSITNVTIGGNVRGGAGDMSGLIYAEGPIGTVLVKGSANGGNGNNAGGVYSAGATGGFTSITINGSLTGGGGDQSASIVSEQGNIGTVKIGKELQGGSNIESGWIYSLGTMNSVTIGGSISGSSAVTDATDSGQVQAVGGITRITVGKAINGGASLRSGSIFAGLTTDVANIGTVLVGTSVNGGSGESSGNIFAYGDIGTVKVTKSVTGGVGQDSGRIHAEGNLTTVTLGGDLAGNANAPKTTGVDNGVISSGGTMGTITIGGSIKGGTGDQSGRVIAIGDITKISVTKSVYAGTGDDTGVIGTDGNLLTAKIGGDLDASVNSVARDLDGFTGGVLDQNFQVGARSARVYAGGAIGDPEATLNDGFLTTTGLTIGGYVKGGNNNDTGEIISDVYGDTAKSSDISGGIIRLTIGKDVVGGPSYGTQLVDRAGYIQGSFIGADFVNGTTNLYSITGGGATAVANNAKFGLSIGGSLIAGSTFGDTSPTNSGAIRASEEITSLKIAGNIIGNASTHAVITALNTLSENTVSLLNALTVGTDRGNGVYSNGNVTWADIEAGLLPSSELGVPVVNSSVIGEVVVLGNWTNSDMVASVFAGSDGAYGDSTDGLTLDTDLPGIDGIGTAGTMGDIFIGGKVFNTASPDANGLVVTFGIVAGTFGTTGITIAQGTVDLTDDVDIAPAGWPTGDNLVSQTGYVFGTDLDPVLTYTL